MHISLIDIVISIALKSVKFHWFRFREYFDGAKCNVRHPECAGASI